MIRSEIAELFRTVAALIALLVVIKIGVFLYSAIPGGYLVLLSVALLIISLIIEPF